MLSGAAPVLGIVEPPLGVAPVLGTVLPEFEPEPEPEPFLLEEFWLLPEDEEPPLDELPPLFDVLFEPLLLPFDEGVFSDELPLLLELLLSTLAVGVVFLEEFIRLYNHFPPIYSPKTSAATNKPVSNTLNKLAGLLTVSVACK